MIARIDIVIILAFIAYAVAAGFLARAKASRNLEEYFLAGRSLKGWKAGISMAATQFAADTPLLVTGLIATAGIFSLWRLWIYTIAFLLMGFLLAASWRRAGVLTDAELTEIRYGGQPAAVLRAFKAVYFGTFFNCIVLAWVLLAATRIAEPFLLWNQWLPESWFQIVHDLVQRIGVPLTVDPEGPGVWILSANNLISLACILMVTTLYSATGGLRSVVETDLVQFAIMMVSTLIFAVIIVHKIGGLEAIPLKLHQLFNEGRTPGGITPSQILAFDPSQAKDVSWALLAVFALQWIVQLNADGTGYLAQRTMACRSDQDARQAALVFTVSQVFVRSLLWLPLGLGLLILFPLDPNLDASLMVAERETTFVRGMAELLPAGIKGLMLTCMLAALASTVDTHLNWGASYWTNDIYKRFFCRHILKREPRPSSLIWVARCSNLLILAIAFLIMGQLSSIQMAWQASLLLGAGMGIMLVLRWLWWRINAWGEITCILMSSVFAPVLLWAFPEAEALRLLLMAIISTSAGIGASFLLGPENKELLKEFYRRARPPGFWGPIARDLGQDKQSKWLLTRASTAIILASITTFFLLTAVGTWVCSSPAPSWFPWRGTYLFLLTTIGLGLIPLWWRLGMQSNKKTTAKKL